MLHDIIHGAQRRLFPARARRWRIWKQHVPQATERIDHAAWDSLLARYARRDADATRVAYASVTHADRAVLAQYIGALESTSVSKLNRPEQFAFWANLYNAVTVRVILDNLPIASLRNIGVLPFWLGGGPWGAKRVSVEGWQLSLNDIEHRILRRNWRDRRIHYALNCGALGCPDLPLRAHAADNLEAALDEAERAYVNDARGAGFDGNRLVVSRIYEWYAADFVAPGESIVEYLRRHARPELAERLAGRRQVDGYRYDWALNATEL